MSEIMDTYKLGIGYYTYAIVNAVRSQFTNMTALRT